MQSLYSRTCYNIIDSWLIYGPSRNKYFPYNIYCVNKLLIVGIYSLNVILEAIKFVIYLIPADNRWKGRSETILVDSYYIDTRVFVKLSINIIFIL